jgi:hypothetical protein
MDRRPSIALLLLAAVVAMPCARKGIRTCVPPPPKAAPGAAVVSPVAKPGATVAVHTGHCTMPGVAGHRS